MAYQDKEKERQNWARRKKKILGDSLLHERRKAQQRKHNMELRLWSRPFVLLEEIPPFSLESLQNGKE